MVTWHITWHESNINFIPENIKDDKFFMCAKFLFSSIICAKVQDNK